MPPDHPLLRAILADPDDDTRRLVAAAWFADPDQPDRAEFAKHHWVRPPPHLPVPDTPITAAAARALLYTPFLQQLRVLVFARDAMTPGVREAFRERFALPESSDLLPF